MNRAMPGESRLASVLGETSLTVSSYHHQSIDVIGAGVRAVGVAPDGVIEALEANDPAKRVIAVQWHPEDTASEDSLQHALFQWLIDEAKVVKG